MSQYYKGKRTRNLFDPASSEPFKLSRTKLENFLNCPRCFYLDRRLGVDRPPGYPFSLNSAVDTLLKKEFDAHRAKGSAHPLMKHYGIEAIPFAHEDLNRWRENFVGVEALHTSSHFLVTGAVDDIWINPAEELIVVDYKSTAKDGEVNLNADWQIGYKRQMEIYQWLLRQNGFHVSDTGYFVYCNGDTDREAFDAKLEFDITLLPYEGKTDWIDNALLQARECLMHDEVPKPNFECDYCTYLDAVNKASG